MKGLVFTYLLTYGGALASIFNPYIGLLIYVCFSIIKPESLWHWAVEPGNYSRIVAIALLAGWALHGFGTWQFGKSKLILASLMGFWAWVAVCATQAGQPSVAFGWFEELSKIVIPFFAGLTLIDSTQKLKQLAWVIVLSHGYVAFEMNLSYYLSPYFVSQEFRFGAMDNNCIAITMVTCVGLALFLGLHARSWWLKGIALFSALLMVHVVFFAFSRGGMLALIITGAVSFFLIPKKAIHYAAFAVLVLAAVRLAGPQVIERFSSAFATEEQRDESAQSRVVMWGICVDVMNNNPIFGIGPRHFPIRATEFGLTPGKEAHTLWLQIGAETGYIGVGFLVAFYAVCCWRLWPISRGRPPFDDPWYADSARMVIASLMGFVVSSQFVSLAGLEVPYYIVLLGAGTLKLASLQHPQVAMYNTAPYFHRGVHYQRSMHSAI